MAKSETFTFVCDKCQIETELPKFLVKTMQHCPFCGARHNPPIDEFQKNIKFSIYSFIDDYGMDFVIDTIRSIKIEEGVSAWGRTREGILLGQMNLQGLDHSSLILYIPPCKFRQSC